MKLNLCFAVAFINVALMITLGGCMPVAESDESATTSPSPLVPTSAVATSVPVTPTVIPTIAVELPPSLVPTSTTTPTITPTLTTTPTSLVGSSDVQPKTCTIPAQRFNVAETLGIRSYAHLTFQGENTILFDGWGPRPEPRNTLYDPAQVTPGPSPDIPSARVLFRAGQIDLETGLILTRTLSVDPLLNDLEAILGLSPDGQWSQEQLHDRVDVLSQSADGQWQLVQISDWSRDVNGIWLVSQSEAVQLVSYVPWSSAWEWADDSSVLWYHHTVYGFGYDALIIYLEHPPLVNRADLGTENPLDATYYRLAFSPVDKTILSTSELREFYQGIDPDKLFIIDAYDTESYIVQTISGLTMPVWNQATQSFILMKWGEDGTDFVDINGTLLVHVPEIVSPFIFALSPSGRRLAVGYGAVDGIWVYECDG
jgi:hypothetical protein